MVDLGKYVFFLKFNFLKLPRHSPYLAIYFIKVNNWHFSNNIWFIWGSALENWLFLPFLENFGIIESSNFQKICVKLDIFLEKMTTFSLQTCFHDFFIVILWLTIISSYKIHFLQCSYDILLFFMTQKWFYHIFIYIAKLINLAVLKIWHCFNFK